LTVQDWDGLILTIDIGRVGFQGRNCLAVQSRTNPQRSNTDWSRSAHTIRHDGPPACEPIRERSRRPAVNRELESERSNIDGCHNMLKFLGSTIGIIFLIGLAVVIGLFALIF
jgi:hypothetical protein